MNLFRSAVFLLLCCFAESQFEWQSRDFFDIVDDQFRRVDKENCKILDINQLFLSNSTVTHIPTLHEIQTEPIFPNRTNLLHVHNMAMSRAFFYSFILQRANDSSEPGFMYHFMSAIADVSANRFINASAIYFGPDRAFTPSYKSFFNKTMPLFAPRAHRVDDFDDPYHISRISTLNTIEASDLGAINPNSQSDNYTHEHYKINKWYYHWLPDFTERQDSKTTYTVKITSNTGSEETFVFHGPPHPADNPGPVKWTQPYFDCDRSNKWILGATSPVVDLYPRHTGWRHIEYPRYVATIVMEIDFERIDINQCPIGEGNPRPNAFAGTARCRNETTECEPLHGYGFRRGGYQCRCRSGFRLPKMVRTPYLGEVIERATAREFLKGFKCEKIGYLAVRTQNAEVINKFEAYKLLGIMRTLTGLHRNSSQRLEPNSFLDQIKKVNSESCHTLMKSAPEQLSLRGDIAHGKETQFENQARMGLRLANFISGFSQVVDPKERYAEFRVPDQPLNRDQIHGEILSLIAGDSKIWSASVMFDRNQFPNKSNPYFASNVFKSTEREQSYTFYIRDLAGKSPREVEPAYMQDKSFTFLRNRWTGNTDQLRTFTTKINIRFNSSGLNTIKYDQYPQLFKAATLDDGYWSAPYYDCGGLNTWLMSYSVPFFGWNKIRDRLIFKGIVSVRMKLFDLDINQCDQPAYETNAFKGTHKCDRESTRCVPMYGRKFETGGYKCECNQGYEYPYLDPVTYVDGQSLESEYLKMEQSKESRFDQLRCRIAGSSSLFHSLTLIVFALIFSMPWVHQIF